MDKFVSVSIKVNSASLAKFEKHLASMCGLHKAETIPSNANHSVDQLASIFAFNSKSVERGAI